MHAIFCKQQAINQRDSFVYFQNINIVSNPRLLSLESVRPILFPFDSCHENSGGRTRSLMLRPGNRSLSVALSKLCFLYILLLILISNADWMGIRKRWHQRLKVAADICSKSPENCTWFALWFIMMCFVGDRNHPHFSDYFIETSYGQSLAHGPLARYVKLRVAHAPGMPGTFSPPPRVSDPDMYHGSCVTHVPWCMSGSLTGGFIWNRWRGKRSRHYQRLRIPQF